MKGKLIYLREVRTSDVNERYQAWLADPEVNQYLETRFQAQSLESIRAFVQAHQSKADEPFWAICLAETDEHIGNIKLGPINWIHRYADISLFIGERKCWGKGCASEAIGLVCDFAFSALNLNRVKAGAYAPNTGSIRAFERNGFEREGLQREQFFSNGRYVDGVLLGLTRANYTAARKSGAGGAQQ